MQIYRLSASALKSFQQCQFKYFLNYIAKIRSSSCAAAKGTVSHAALEEYGNGNKDYVQSLKKAYQEHRPDAQDAGYENNTKDCENCPFFKSGVCDILDKKIEDFDGCPRSAFEECQMLTERFLNREDCPLKINKIISTEKEFNIKIFDIDTIGFIDLISQSPVGLEIRDYKFGKYVPSYKNIRDDLQPKLYDLAIKELMPERADEIHLVFDYVQGKEYVIIYTKEEAEENKREIIRLIKQIQNTIIPKRIAPGFKCERLCVGRDACDKYYEKYAKQGFVVDDIDEEWEEINE